MYFFFFFLLAVIDGTACFGTVEWEWLFLYCVFLLNVYLVDLQGACGYVVKRGTCFTKIIWVGPNIDHFMSFAILFYVL